MTPLSTKYMQFTSNYWYHTCMYIMHTPSEFNTATSKPKAQMMLTLSNPHITTDITNIR